MVSWFPLIMPEMYDRLDPTDSSSKWDFSKYTPDLVVINLLQNDSWIIKIPDNEQFKKRFGTKPPDSSQIIELIKILCKRFAQLIQRHRSFVCSAIWTLQKKVRHGPAMSKKRLTNCTTKKYLPISLLIKTLTAIRKLKSK